MLHVHVFTQPSVSGYVLGVLQALQGQSRGLVQAKKLVPVLSDLVSFCVLSVKDGVLKTAAVLIHD